jgi:hypothetical protein
MFFDRYCERLGTNGALWQEPLNSFSNIGFILCACFLLYKHYRSPTSFSWKTFDITVLILLIASIGIGSALWHYYATPPYMWADIIPISLFLNLYFVVFLLRIAKVSIKQTIIAWCLFQLITYLCQTYLPPNLLYGTVMYIPAFVILSIMTLYVILTFHHSALPMVKVSILWSVSLFFRTIDLPACSLFSIGTHFIWHLLNAVVLYMLVSILLSYKQNETR